MFALLDNWCPSSTQLRFSHSSCDRPRFSLILRQSRLLIAALQYFREGPSSACRQPGLTSKSPTAPLRGIASIRWSRRRSSRLGQASEGRRRMGTWHLQDLTTEAAAPPTPAVKPAAYVFKAQGTQHVV